IHVFDDGCTAWLVTLVRQTESLGVMLQFVTPLSATNGAHEEVTNPSATAAPTSGDVRRSRRSRRARPERVGEAFVSMRAPAAARVEAAGALGCGTGSIDPCPPALDAKMLQSV